MRREERTVILHMSDFHFGIPDRRQSGAARQDMLNSFLECYGDLLRERPHWAPDVLVLSGDIAWSGSEDEYQVAKDFLNRFLSLPGNKISPSQVVVCFGNHDKCADSYLRPAPDNEILAFDNQLQKYVMRPERKIKGSPEERALKDDYALMTEDVEEYYHCFQNVEKFCNDMNFVNLKSSAAVSKYRHAYGVCTVKGIEFIALNTEWDFWGSKDKCAEGHLRLGLKICQAASTKPLRPFMYGMPARFVVYHRSLGHLHAMEQRSPDLFEGDKRVGNLIHLNDVSLNGHEHEYHIRKFGAHTEILAGAMHSTDAYKFSCNLISIPTNLEPGLNECKIRRFFYCPGNVFNPWSLESEGETVHIIRLKDKAKISEFLNAMSLLLDEEQSRHGKQIIATIYPNLTGEEKQILIAILSEDVFREVLEFAKESKQTKRPEDVYQADVYQSEDKVPTTGPTLDTDRIVDDMEGEQECSQDLTKTLIPTDSAKHLTVATGLSPIESWRTKMTRRIEDDGV